MPAQFSRKSLAIVVVLGLAAVLALPFDVVLARFFLDDPFPGEMRSLIHKTEFFGHAYGILGIAFTIFLLDENRRKRIPRILVAALMAGLACDAIKLLVHRVRPCNYSFAENAPTFLGLSFQHATSLGDMFQSAYHSFPSAHTATAVAFALVLGSVYPKGRWWFVALAILVAFSRFDGGAHYVSDTCVGGIVGYLTAHWILGNSHAARWFDRFESNSDSSSASGPRLYDPGDTPSERAA
jgi:membrane-associated phospholipid phosphatase